MHAVGIDVGGMAASAVIAAAIGVYQGYLNSLVGEGIMRDIRTSLVNHLHRMPLSFFTETKTGEIMNRVSSDVDNVDSVVTGTLGLHRHQRLHHGDDGRDDLHPRLAASRWSRWQSFR